MAPPLAEQTRGWRNRVTIASFKSKTEQCVYYMYIPNVYSLTLITAANTTDEY